MQFRAKIIHKEKTKWCPYFLYHNNNFKHTLIAWIASLVFLISYFISSNWYVASCCYGKLKCFVWTLVSVDWIIFYYGTCYKNNVHLLYNLFMPFHQVLNLTLWKTIDNNKISADLFTRKKYFLVPLTLTMIKLQVYLMVNTTYFVSILPPLVLYTSISAQHW